jgi:hypothetical protein
MFKLSGLDARLLNYTILVFSSLWLNIECFAQTPPQSLTVPFSAHHSPAHANYYYEELLQLALAKTEAQYGKTIIKFYPFYTGRERQRAILKNNAGLDIIWSPTNQEREQQLLAVKFNLLPELSDYKILLIRKEDKEKFSAVTKMADLRNFKAGTGLHWQDTQILQKNNMPLVKSWNYDPMFKMLAAKRFDYMIRGAEEIWSELELHPNSPFMAEEKLLIHYKLPVYFFVNPNNTQLAARLKTGLDIAQKDGSLNQLLLSLPAFKKGYAELHNKNRRLISMENTE